MKRKVIILIVTLMIFTLAATSTVFGATMSSWSNGTITQGGTTTVNFYIDSATISSGSIELSCTSDLEIVSGKWLLSGTTMADFTNNKGAAAFSKPTAITGGYFQVTVRGKAISRNASVTATAILKNGSTVVATVSAKQTINVICASHSFGAWTEHAATCESDGYRQRVCSVCGAIDTQTIAALGHKLENTTITKHATCLEEGTETGTCSVCHQTVTQTIAAKGHSYGPWMVVNESTCQEHGEEQRTCRDCGAVETQEAALKDHDFGTDYEVVREATISVPGLVRGTCHNCGEMAEQLIPCCAKDEATGVKFEAEEGVFQPGTTITVKKLEPGELGEKVLAVVDALGSKYQAYSISAMLKEVAVQPNGTVLVTLNVPEGFGDNFALVYIDDEGNTEFVGFVKNGDGTITATLTHFSTYALIDLAKEVVTPGLPKYWIYIAAGEAVLVAVFIVLWLTTNAKMKTWIQREAETAKALKKERDKSAKDLYKNKWQNESQKSNKKKK